MHLNLIPIWLWTGDFQLTHQIILALSFTIKNVLAYTHDHQILNERHLKPKRSRVARYNIDHLSFCENWHYLINSTNSSITSNYFEFYNEFTFTQHAFILIEPKFFFFLTEWKYIWLKIIFDIVACFNSKCKYNTCK